MAAEFVGGALLSAFIQTAVDRLASPQVVDFFRGRKLDEKLLNKLKGKLRFINAVVDDAELKQIENQLVRDWLFEVKDVVHDAEDLLDEIDYELTRCQVEAESEPQTFFHKGPRKIAKAVKCKSSGMWHPFCSKTSDFSKAQFCFLERFVVGTSQVLMVL